MGRILDAITTAYDFWTGKHPAERVAPQRKWDVPQMAGYEGHPMYEEAAGMFRRNPEMVAGINDFTFNSELKDKKGKAHDEAYGHYTIKDKSIQVLPVTSKQVERTTGHEIGHHHALKTTKHIDEVLAESLALDLENRKPPNDEMIRTIIRAYNRRGQDDIDKTNVRIGEINKKVLDSLQDLKGTNRVPRWK